MSENKQLGIIENNDKNGNFTEEQINIIKSLIIGDVSFINSLHYKELSFTERLLVENILEGYKIKAFSSLDELNKKNEREIK